MIYPLDSAIQRLNNRGQMNKTALDKVSSQYKTLNDSFEELNGEHPDASCNVDEIESYFDRSSLQISLW